MQNFSILSLLIDFSSYISSSSRIDEVCLVSTAPYIPFFSALGIPACFYLPKAVEIEALPAIFYQSSK